MAEAAKVSSREAIARVLADGETKTTSEICEAAAEFATGLKFNPRHQLEATLHAEARKPTGVVERVGRGTFRLRQASDDATPEVESGIKRDEVPLPPLSGMSLGDAMSRDEQRKQDGDEKRAKPDPKPARKRSSRSRQKTAA